MTNLSVINPDLDAIKNLSSAFTKFKKICNEKPEQKYNKISRKNYTPISEVENSLDEIMYLGWRKEIIKYECVLNSICVHLRLHYTNPVSGVQEFTDGVGACPIQTKADTKPLDTENIKSAAIQMALPAAAAYALKDAAETFGKKFGRDVARDHVAEFEPIIKYTDGILKSAMKNWDMSDKTQVTLDVFLKEARKQGIEKEFTDYVQGKANG